MANTTLPSMGRIALTLDRNQVVRLIDQLVRTLSDTFEDAHLEIELAPRTVTASRVYIGTRESGLHARGFVTDHDLTPHQVLNRSTL